VSRARNRRVPLLAQAEVAPLDVDGIRTLAVGTALWLVAFVALLPFAARLRADGREWWLATCLTGVGLGLLGLAYCVWRRSRERRSAQESSDDATSG
jgi:hypothetical protein